MIRTRLDLVVEVRAEAEDPFPSTPFRGDLDGGERRVLDQDTSALDRCYKPVFTVFFTTENRGE